MIIKDWNIEAMTGYKPKTTFYTDFSIADHFGTSAILDTYHRAVDEWKNNIVYVTELVMAVNWKAFEHQDNDELCELYTYLYYDLDDYVLHHFTGDDLTYYIQTTD